MSAKKIEVNENNVSEVLEMLKSAGKEGVSFVKANKKEIVLLLVGGTVLVLNIKWVLAVKGFSFIMALIASGVSAFSVGFSVWDLVNKAILHVADKVQGVK